MVTPKQEQVVELIREHGPMTKEEIRQRLGFNSVGRMILKLMREGIVVRKINRRNPNMLRPLICLCKGNE